MKRYIPHILTLLNLFSGCVATVFAVLNRLDLAALWVCIGIFFDFFDGFAARRLKVQSALGVQLDSLADMVTSGVVPGMVMFQLLTTAQTGGWNLTLFRPEASLTVVPFMGFIITLGAAYRLAYFNIDEDQATSFKGLPTPANALWIISLPLIVLYQNPTVLHNLILNTWFLLGLTLVSAFLMNAQIRLFALKFTTWGFKDNAARYVFLLGSLLLLVSLRFMAVPLVILWYILTSWAMYSSKKG